MHRLFLALRPPAPIRRALAAAMTGVPGARWQDDDQLHLTIRFIGEVDGRVAEDAAIALSAIRAAAPVVRITGVGQFEHRGRTDTLWAAVHPVEALAALHRKADRALVAAGLPPERRAYRPHITLARLARGAAVEPEIARWLVDHAALASPDFTLDSLILYESRLGSRGASYEPVDRWPLG